MVNTFPVCHNLDAVGFEICSKDKKKVFYSGDTGKGLSKLWKKISPDLLILDGTFPNRMENIALDSGHLCPKLIEQELADFQRLKGYLPIVYLNHMHPKLEDEIKKDVEKIRDDLKKSIHIAKTGETIVI